MKTMIYHIKVLYQISTLKLTIFKVIYFITLKGNLDSFGTLNNEDAEYNIIVNCFSTLEELNNTRSKYENLPLLILVQNEKDMKKIEKYENEEILPLPFYPSKINDTLQDLLSRKTP